jgi:phosphoribosylanthranilate isomerase
MKLKVCGITQLEQLIQLDSLGINYGGLIFYDQSLRWIDNKLKAEEVKLLPLTMQKVGVFVNAEESYILEQVENFGLDLVQLHGDETPGFCNQISSQVTVIKVFRITQTNEQNIDWMVKPYEEYCDYYLFDTNRKNAYGGTGEKFDWKILNDNKINKPFFLSGGIGLGDVEKLRTFEHPFFYCIDLNSRVEITVGIKDIDAIHKMSDQLLFK